MTAWGSALSPSAVVRGFLATATVVFAVLGFVIGHEPRLFVASAAFGGLWWGWDLIVEYVFRPFERIFQHVLGGGLLTGSSADTRPDLDDIIRLLENHLKNPTSRQVDINAALRLEEIYRLVKKDEARAREVVRIVRERYPDWEKGTEVSP